MCFFHPAAALMTPLRRLTRSNVNSCCLSLVTLDSIASITTTTLPSARTCTLLCPSPPRFQYLLLVAPLSLSLSLSRHPACFCFRRSRSCCRSSIVSAPLVKLLWHFHRKLFICKHHPKPQVCEFRVVRKPYHPYQTTVAIDLNASVRARRQGEIRAGFSARTEHEMDGYCG
jgi:hypothetical protein